MGTIDRRPYESAASLTQDVLDQSQDNLAQKLEMVVEVDTPVGTKNWSDRAKYVGSTFYENRVEFPTIERTVGDWLAGTLEFSGLEITVNNTDKLFSDILPGGASYAGWIDRKVEVKIGLGEISPYTTVFEGFVTDIGGFQRDVSTFTLVCRNKFDSVNVSVPNQVLIEDDWPDIEDEFIGLAAPIIYGDYNVELRPEGSMVPAFPVNGKDPLVNASLDPVDPNVGDTALRLVISSTPIKTLDTATITLLRGDEYFIFSSGDISIVGGSFNQVFDITQKNLLIDGSPWIYETGDEFYVRVDGVDLLTNDDNIVSQAQDVLTRFGGLSLLDFDSTWTTFRDKTTPSESAISTILSRVWVQDSNKAIDLAAAMLEQVRLEPFINRDNKWSLCSLHFDEIPTAPTYTIKNWDIGRDTFKPQIDERNNFNRAQADFDFNPAKGENRRSTPIFKNAAAITQAGGREISKLITFPNLYRIGEVEDQLKEMIKLASGYTELATMTLTSRSFLKDICDYVQLSIDIGSIEFSEVGDPIVGMIRDLSYIPGTMGIGAKIWIFQMINFPGYTGPAGTVGGFDATIEQEI